MPRPYTPFQVVQATGGWHVRVEEDFGHHEFYGPFNTQAAARSWLHRNRALILENPSVRRPAKQKRKRT